MLLLDHEPSAGRDPPHPGAGQPARELSLVDQQEQLRDCWDARAGLPERRPDRRRLRRPRHLAQARAQPAPPARPPRPDPRPRRRAPDRRAALGDDGQPPRRHARDRARSSPRRSRSGSPAPTCTTRRCRTSARSCTAPSSRTSTPTPCGSTTARCSTPPSRSSTPAPTSPPTASASSPRSSAASSSELDAELDTLAARAKSQGAQAPHHRRDPRPRPQRPLRLRPRARTGLRRRHLGRRPRLHARPRPRAARRRRRRQPAREEAYFAGARLDDDELRDAAARGRAAPSAGARPARRGDPQQPRARPRHPRRADRPHRRASSTRSTQIVCHLLARHYRELIAYGAGWTDPERQQPVGDTGRHEPRQLDAIVDAELERALADPDPLRGIAQLTARWAAAFVLDPAGVTRTKALGTERMARKLRDALPGGDGALRAAVWEFMRPMLSPALVDAQPRRVRHRRERRDHRRPRRPPRGVRPRRARPRRRARRRRSVGPAVRLPSSRPGHQVSGREDRRSA